MLLLSESCGQRTHTALGGVEQQEWDWGRRPAVAGLHSLPPMPSPRSQSLQGQAAGGKGQPRGGAPVLGPLGAAAGLSTKVRLNRAMALVLQAAAAMGMEGPAEFFLHRAQQSWEAPSEGRNGISEYTQLRRPSWANSRPPHTCRSPRPRPHPLGPRPSQLSWASARPPAPHKWRPPRPRTRPITAPAHPAQKATALRPETPTAAEGTQAIWEQLGLPL